MATQLLFTLMFWQDEESRWMQFWVGETYGIDWLWLLGGTLFIAAIGYAIYASMLYNVINANRHPANFRKLIWALGFLLWIFWFQYVFWHAFGGYMLYFLLLVWITTVVVFLSTRRKPRIAQS